MSGRDLRFTSSFLKIHPISATAKDISPLERTGLALVLLSHFIVYVVTVDRKHSLLLLAASVNLDNLELLVLAR